MAENEVESECDNDSRADVFDGSENIIHPSLLTNKIYSMNVV